MRTRTRKAFLVPNERCVPHAGKRGTIDAVEAIFDDNGSCQLCYLVTFADGTKMHFPIGNRHYYDIVPEIEQAEALRLVA